MDKLFKPKKKLKNPFAPKPNYGGGQSLGGSHPGRVIKVELSNPGPLGVKVEKRNNSSKSAIIAMVVPGSQAEAAGLMRGDICCFAGSNGQEEIKYEQFLKMAASSQRPMLFEVRRLEENKKKSSTGTSQSKSADAEARKRAMVAAAEKRANTTKSKPTKKDALPTITSTAEKRRLEQEREERLLQQQEEEPMSLEAKKAVEAAKKQEDMLSAQLGYNPYETNKASAGKGRTAAVAMTHGAIQADSDKSSGTTPPAAVSPPPSSLEATNDSHGNKQDIPVSDDFHNAFTTLVTTNSNDDVVLSLGILRKLIVNATTKGQVSEDSGKFRRVRLGNEKIRAAVTDMNGAFELMQSVGFQLVEEDDEAFLVFPYPSNGPAWLSSALQSMQQYETS